ncbi:MAG: S-layer homology domain-containing protein [Clostridia bacterium]|nr:S-layer homology domain-containing protein [Clostridia bacterium]
MKKILSVLLAAALMLGTAVIVNSDTPSSWAQAEVNAGIAEGLVPADLQKDYTSPVTRGSVALMFINLLEKSSGKAVGTIMEEKNVSPDPSAFSDTSDPAVLAANALGIINGTGSGKFSPDGTLKRAQIAAIINRVARVMGIDTEGYSHDFTDITGNYSWAGTELGWPVHAGVINGVGNNKFNPGGDLTAEQAILITYRAFTAFASYSKLTNPDPAARVIIFGVDGAGDFFKDADTPRIDGIFADGAVTHQAKAAEPSYSGVNWGSILHGSDAAVHRLNNSSDTPFPMKTSVPSFFRVVRDAFPEAEMASIVHWSIVNAGLLEDAEAINIHKDTGNDAEVCDKVIEYLDSHDPKLLYMHFDNIDEAGHNSGYGSPSYLGELTVIDSYIGRIYDKLKEKGMLEDSVLILTPDHGGTYVTNDDGSSSGSHGGSSPEELTCMVAVTGKGVRKGEFGDMPLKDIASIVLYALGVEQPSGYTSMVPSGVFEGVEAGTRPVYTGVHNTRFDHEGEDTPEADSGRYITDLFPAEDIISYMTLDGAVKNEAGKARASGKGTIEYSEGYYGSSAGVFDGGYILSGYQPDTSSFSVSLWILIRPVGENGPIMTNQYWYRYKYVEGGTGITLALRDSSVRASIGVQYSVDGGEIDEEWVCPLPDDYREGWVHTVIIADRENGRIGLAVDFGDIRWFRIPDEYRDDAFSGNVHGLLFGTDVTAANLKNPVEYDDIIIFGKALSQADIDTLAGYYQVK